MGYYSYIFGDIKGISEESYELIMEIPPLFDEGGGQRLRKSYHK